MCFSPTMGVESRRARPRGVRVVLSAWGCETQIGKLSFKQNITDYSVFNLRPFGKAVLELMTYYFKSLGGKRLLTLFFRYRY